MSDWMLLAVSMVACLGGGVIRKYLCQLPNLDTRFHHGYNAVVSLVAALALTAISGISAISPFTAVLGVAFGLITAIQQVANLQATETGPFSYTAVIVSLSTLIPTLSGMIFWEERISGLQLVGIVLMVGCFVLSVEPDAGGRKATVRWLVCCAITFVCTGLIGVMQKWHQSTAYKEELNGFLIIAFGISCLYSGGALAVQAVRCPAGRQKGGLGLLAVLLMAVSGICVAVNNVLNLRLSGVMDSAVFFPVVNGGGLVLTTLAALLLFREKLSRRRWIGLILGFLSVLLLCSPAA